jgi:MFS family permease
MDDVTTTDGPRSDGAMLRSIAPSVFLPALVYEIGNGAITPVIVLTALADGAAPSTAAFVLSLLGIGQILGDVPASALADRLGERRAMMLAAGVAILGSLVCFGAHNLIVLCAALIVIGTSNATFYLARQSYISEVVPVRLRARALSTLAGAHRVGLFIGPFAGALVISLSGIRDAYLVAVASAATAAVLLLVIPDVRLVENAVPSVRGTVSARRMLTQHRRLFATLGLAVLGVGATRAARQTVLPLWAEHIGLSAEKTSIVFGIAYAVEMVMFYPSGKVMDQFGRLWVALPAMLILGGSMIVLPLTHSEVPLAAVAIVMGVGNGIGSGIMMTLGADAAPAANRTRFLSIWRVFSDSGNAAGPVVVSLVSGVATLALGVASAGVLGLLSAAALAVWVPRYSPFGTRAAMARAREAAAASVTQSSPPAARDART